MRYAKILFLNFTQVFEVKSKIFVYFLQSLIAPFLFSLFWVGARVSGNKSFNFSTIASYYLLFIVISPFLMCHMENDIGIVDIHEGNLVQHLLKPFSFFWFRFIQEFSYRILQASMGIVLVIFLLIFFGNFFTVTHSLFAILLTIIIAGLALFLSYTYKVILGLLAFWLSDVTGIFQLSEMFLYIFAGYIVPIYIFPKVLETIAYVLPFSYMIYFPVISLQGRLSVIQSLDIIFIQLLWLTILLGIYKYTWKKGREKFLGVGQ